MIKAQRKKSLIETVRESKIKDALHNLGYKDIGIGNRVFGEDGNALNRAMSGVTDDNEREVELLLLIQQMDKELVDLNSFKETQLQCNSDTNASLLSLFKYSIGHGIFRKLSKIKRFFKRDWSILSKISSHPIVSGLIILAIASIVGAVL